MVQFGIHGDPKLNEVWREANITDDPVTQSNKRGYITFATSGPNSRTTQVFINFRDNAGLDPQGFAPFGQVVSGMEVVDKLNGEYWGGTEPDAAADSVAAETHSWRRSFPRLDYIKKATIEKPAAPPPPVKTVRGEAALAQYVARPPLISNTAPVENEHSSEDSQQIRAATSSSSRKRPIGIRASM